MAEEIDSQKPNREAVDPASAGSRSLVTVIYEVIDEEEWIKVNPLKYEHHGLKAVASGLSDAFAEIEKLERDVAQWKKNFIPFAIVHAGQYGKDHYGKEGCLHFTHYDLLKEAGARLVDFTRCGDSENA